MSQSIRVIVVDDSALMRRVITGLLEQDPSIRVVATARNGREAIDLVQELRETKASSFTLRDTPMFTCRRRTLGECLDALG